MRDRAQKIGLHLLLLRFGFDAFLPLDPVGQHADDQRNREHRQKRQRITRDGEIKSKIGIGERVVHADDRNDRCYQTE